MTIVTKGVAINHIRLCTHLEIAPKSVRVGHVPHENGLNNPYRVGQITDTIAAEQIFHPTMIGNTSADKEK
jgi:hypothetical protein